MSEQLHSSHNRAPEPEPNPAQEVFSTQLQELGVLIPEIAERQEQITAEAHNLIERANIGRRFFNDRAHTLMLASIANRYSKFREMEPTEEAGREQGFLNSAMIGLVDNYDRDLLSPFYRNDEKRQQVYDKYTDKNLTSELDGAINNGLLDGVKQRMKVDESNEDPYELRVLSLDSGLNTYGLEGPAYDWDDEKSFEENHQELLDAMSDHALVMEHKVGLAERAKSFERELGMEDRAMVAWVIEIDGKNQLCVTMPLAEKLLHPELTENNKDYTDTHRERDLAILEHEYVHTQEGLNLDGATETGIALEELRAEHFSGNRHGYQDVKYFYSDVELLTGLDVRDIFDELPKGGRPFEVYGLIAKQVGLDTMLDLVSIAPGHYCSQSKAQSRINTDLGGYDGVTEKIFRKQIAAGLDEIIDERVDERARKLKELAGNEFDWVMGFREQELGLSFLTDLIRYRAQNPKEAEKDTIRR